LRRECKCDRDIYFEFTSLYLGCIDTDHASGETWLVLINRLKGHRDLTT
jgi:hypothetical protein